jgi:hypothetical protein
VAPLWDVGLRIQHMDDAEVDKQVITHSVPPIEQAATDPGVAAQLAFASNSAALEMAKAHPDHVSPGQSRARSRRGEGVIIPGTT